MEVDFSSNYFIGSLPDEAFKHFNAVQYFDDDISANRLVGTLPGSLGNMTSLVNLYMAFNDFTGKIPDQLINCQNLTVLCLSGNQITGTIPVFLWEQFPKLNAVILGSNKLQGTAIGNLSALYYLNLSFNSMEGTLSNQ